MENETLIINKYSSVPLYRQLEHYLIHSIKSGRFPYGSTLPSETDLCQILDVSLFAVKTAYNGLKRNGFIKTVKRKGTVVTYRQMIHAPIVDVLDFEKYHPSVTPIYELISINMVTNHAAAHGLLHLEEGVPLIAIKRRVLNVQSPICFQSIYLAKELFELEEQYTKGRFSLEAFLNKYNGGELQHQFTPLNLESWQAFFLDMQPGDAGHLIKTVLVDSQNEPILCVLSIFPGQHVQWDINV